MTKHFERLFWILFFLKLVSTQYTDRFELVKFNNSNEFGVLESFKQKYFISNIEKTSLIKCASLCFFEKNCLSFFYIKNKSICQLFSTDHFNVDVLTVGAYRIYKLKSNSLNSETSFNLVSATTEPTTPASTSQITSVHATVTDSTTKFISSSTITTTITTTTRTTSITTINASTSTIHLEYSCVNQDCTCFDISSFFSKLQNKCIKCRTGWTPFRDVCYQGFSSLRTWSNYEIYCASLNSTLLITEDWDKFNFFRNVSKNLTTLSGSQRTWVYAKYSTLNVFVWINNRTLNSSYFAAGSVTTNLGCFSYYTTPSSMFGIYGCTLTSNGICEYTE